MDITSDSKGKLEISRAGHQAAALAISPSFSVNMKTFAVALLGLVSLSVAAPTLEARETAQEATDRLLFRTSISAFESARNAQNPSTLDWTSDGCSSSPDNPFGFDFIQSCHRHVR
jgi:hypothetical protein